MTEPAPSASIEPVWFVEATYAPDAAETRTPFRAEHLARILALKEAGASLILLGFLHFQEEVEFFGRRVIPLVRELEAEAARGTAVAAE